MQEHGLRDVFNKRLRLNPGGFLYQIKVDKKMHMVSQRFTESVDIDYPLLHLLVAEEAEGCFVGLSGYTAGPIYQTFETRTHKAILEHFKPLARDNMKGSADYKRLLLDDALKSLLTALEVQDD